MSVIGLFIIAVAVNPAFSDLHPSIKEPVDIILGHLSPYSEYPISLPAMERGIARYQQENRTPELNIRYDFIN